VNFDFKGVEMSVVAVAITTVVLGVLGGFIGSLLLGKRLFTAKTGAFAHLSLQTIQDVKDGFVCIENTMLELKGATGIAQTVLRPAGKVIIGKEIYDAVALTGFIEKGEEIVVAKVEATQLYVEKR
jgi:membrane-bound serine protease (ClpP class)